MPVVTDITRQRKRTERYSIFVDGSYRFSLSDLELSNSGLAIGQELAASEVERWEGDSEVSKALGRAHDLLARRPRSRHELERYLKTKDYSETVTERVVERLTEQGLLDDLAFARQWITERSQSRSRYQLTQELRLKGIAPDIIAAGLDELTGETERVAVRRLIEKRLRSSRPPDRQALIAYLSTKGFNYGLIKAVLEEDFSESLP